MNLITNEIISSHELKITQSYPDCGGVCSFEGIVRNHHKGKRVKRLMYESYVPMAEKVLNELKREIEREWSDSHITVKHRVGDLQIGDVAVAIVVWSPHRAEAFTACQTMIDRIKKRVPIWKKEFYGDDTHDWVECHHHGE